MIKTHARTAERAEYRTLFDHEDYRAASDRLAELEALARHQRNLLHEAQEVRRNAPGRQVLLDAEAEALIQDEPMTPDERLAVDLGKLSHEIAVSERAIELQKEIQGRIRARVARELRTERLVDHKAIHARVVAAADQLAAAMREETDFQDLLVRDGLDCGGPVEPLGHPKLFGNGYEIGQFHLWLSEVRQTYQQK